MKHRLLVSSLAVLGLIGLALPSSGARTKKPPKLRGYVADVGVERSSSLASRHERVALRRKGPAVMVHRGAAAFAPENTLEAYAAAMDYGADGCEVDIRRTSDGVLVLFHDDMLDQLTNGFGQVRENPYYHLLSLKPRFIYGRATSETRPPTFAALLALAQQRAMLLHLDVKEPNLEADIAEMLTRADAWDHVVAVNNTTAPKLLTDKRVKLLKYKGPGLYAGRKDVDPDAIAAQLAQPGELIMVDDPRVAARVLKRPAVQKASLPKKLTRDWEYRPLTAPPASSVFVPSIHLAERVRKTDPKNPEALMALLGEGKLEERTFLDGTPFFQRERTGRILDRAWAAQQLGMLERPSTVQSQLLEFQVKNRSLHPEWMYHGLDGAMAVRALGMLKSEASVPLLIQTFNRVDPELKRVQNPAFGPHPLAWTDFRTKMYVLPALGELRTPESKKFLLRYARMSEERARELAPIQFVEATKAVWKHDLNRQEIEELLKSPNSDVRGTALLLSIDHPQGDARELLKVHYPWAVNLPRAED